MNRNRNTLLAALVLLAIGVAAYLWWPREPLPELPPPIAQPAPIPAPTPAVSSGASTAEALATEPAASAAALPPLAESDSLVTDALIDLIGRPSVLSFLQTDGFVRRLVATVDNLPRGHVATRVWPVNPTAGKFTVDDAGKVAPENAARYESFVQLVDKVEPVRAAAMYKRMYPLLQQAYEDLGYPKQRFHARLLEVIDHLLATPQPSGPVTLTLPQIKGPIPSQRPWVRYEYADPSLESLSAGQKMMLRGGEANRQRLTAWLRAFRAQIVR